MTCTIYILAPNVKNQKGGYGMKAINNAAKNKETLTCACNNCDPKDVCYLCDVRDHCQTCDSEWCSPFVGDKD